MNKKIILPTLLIALVALIGVGIYNFAPPSSDKTVERFAWEEEESELPKELRIREAFAWNFEITKDESLGYPPMERMAAAIDQTRRLQDQYYGNADSREGLEDARWKERGPSNIGGRTRALLIDALDPERKKVWAGSVSGGLWYTNDIDADDPQWIKVNDYYDNLAIGAIVQDPQDPNVMYFGTGEAYGSIDAGLGIGLFKSTNNGVDWELIPSTAAGNTNNFLQTQSMEINPENGDIYAGTTRGLFRSQDEGNTWTKVLGQGLGSANFFNDVKYSAGKIYASTDNIIYKSESGNIDTWTALGGGTFPTGWRRCEFSICASDPNIMYTIGRVDRSIPGGGTALEASRVYTSIDGGDTWTQRARPEQPPGNEFTNGQVWYDLDIAIDPFDCTKVMVGGVPNMHTANTGLNWVLSTGNNYVEAGGHVDQHVVLYDEERPGRILHGNDGGVYIRYNGPTSPVVDKNFGYNVTQFYAGAIHPEKYSNYILGGTQDNNSLRLNAFGVSTAEVVLGGDGMFCHIDQDDGQIQIVSSQFGNYSISTNGGDSYSGGVSVNGGFVNISDYDNDANILYAQSFENDNSVWRHHIDNSFSAPVDMGVSFISALHCDPNTPNRLYIGSSGGRVYRIDNANEGTSFSPVQISQVGGTILSIDVEFGNPDHLLITRGNYGAENNIYESTDGGETWVGVEGTAVPNNLPDVPVRWGIFHPEDATQAMIATEVGVWATENLDGENTVWFPPVPGRGTPLVRTDMLQVRRSDRFVLAATHGRGMFTSDVWADAKALLAVPRVGYAGGRVLFNGSASVNATNYAWDLGDGTTSEEEDFYHTYDNIGQYPVSLILNNDTTNDEDLNVDGNIKILPNRPTPYTAAEAEYSGSFESNEEQWGIDNIAGNSTWERGNSTQTWKDGTNSGENAFSIAKDEQYYEENSEAHLYLPNFDFSEQTIYEFSFFAKYNLAPGRDGFNIEYSTNKGETWTALGSSASGWYNFPNDNFGTTTPFPFGSPFFTGDVGAFRQYKLNVTELLSGRENVAFRFVFRSGSSPGNYAGVVIDDVQIKKFAGDPVTTITQQSLTFDETTSPDELVVKWTTLPEFYADKFEVYTSENGLNFERQETVDATGVVTSSAQTYTVRLPGSKNLYFAQILAYSENQAIGLNDTLRAEVMVANKNSEDGIELFSVDPNPFVTGVNLTFTDFINEDVRLELYDVTGKLLASEVRAINGFTTRYDAPNLATGRYLLRYTIGDQDPKLFRILKVAN